MQQQQAAMMASRGSNRSQDQMEDVVTKYQDKYGVNRLQHSRQLMQEHQKLKKYGMITQTYDDEMHDLYPDSGKHYQVSKSIMDYHDMHR